MHCLMELARGVVQWNLKPAKHRLKENAQRFCRKTGPLVIFERRGYMDLLLKCITVFKHLLEYRYCFVLGRKNIKKVLMQRSASHDSAHFNISKHFSIVIS